MITILRYELTSAINDCELPVGYKILNVGVATDNLGFEKISIWCEVEVDENLHPYHTERVRFLIYGTGAYMDDIVNFNPKYIGTIQKSNRYAFHIYKVDNK